MRPHPVGVRLDQARPLPVPGVVQRVPGHRVGGQHVVAVHPDAGEAEAGGAPVERDAGLPLQRLGDGVLVVLAEEHQGGVEHAGPDERLVDVTLAGGAVAEVGDHRLTVVGAGLAVHRDAHGVPGRVQGLRPDHDRVHVELELVRVPAALVDAAEQAQRHDRVDAAAVEHAVLAVGGEGHVLRTQGPPRTDLGRLLAEQARPDAQLALPLQGRRLGVQLPDQNQVAVEAAVLLVGEVDAVLGAVRTGHAVDPLTRGGEQLYQFRVAGRGLPGTGCGSPAAGAGPGVALCHPSLPVVSASAPGGHPAARLVRRPRLVPGSVPGGPRLAPVGVAARHEPDSWPNPVRERRRPVAPTAWVRGGRGCAAAVAPYSHQR